MNKYLNYDSVDFCDAMINLANPLIIKIKVQTIIAENFKELAI